MFPNPPKPRNVNVSLSHAQQTRAPGCTAAREQPTTPRTPRAKFRSQCVQCALGYPGIGSTAPTEPSSYRCSGLPKHDLPHRTASLQAITKKRTSLGDSEVHPVSDNVGKRRRFKIILDSNSCHEITHMHLSAVPAAFSILFLSTSPKP